MSDTNADAARKRRIAMRNQKRSSSTEGDQENFKRLRTSSEDDEVIEVIAEPVPSKPKPHITGIKKQSRYDPGVPMTRDELKAWRKEARRVRNRESAAASRKKNRERVSELETEVDGLKAKYAAALKMIVHLEASRSSNDCAPFTPPALLRQDLMEMQGSSRPASPNGPQATTVSPPQSPSVPPMDLQQDLIFGIHHQDHLQGYDSRQQHSQAPHYQHKSQHQHITMISRPIAAKISPGADADNFVGDEQEGNIEGNHDISCHGDDRDNLMMMKMMNAPHEPIPYGDEWEQAASEYATISENGSSSGCGSECSDDLSNEQQQQYPPANEQREETDLREFLMDTFEGVDVMAAMDDLPELDI